MANNTPTTTLVATGDAFVLTSNIKFEDIQNLKKFGKDEALTLRDSETKEPIFVVKAGDKADASKFGVVFTSANEEGNATATFNFPKLNMTKASKQTHIRDKFAPVLANLAKVEAQVAEAVKSLAAEISALDAATTIR